MRIRILGSAAGGGLPQWNCLCANCRAARQGNAGVRPRTQSSVAVTADGRSWFLLNASADVRTQLTTCGDLWPPVGHRRGTPIAGCVLTDAEIDHASGLLQLREGCNFGIFSTPIVRQWLSQYLTIGPVLSSFASRPWTELVLDEVIELPLPSAAQSGLRLRPFDLGPDIPRFVPTETTSARGSRVGLVIEDASSGGKFVFAPGLSTISESLREAALGADCLMIDGTFWSDDEPLAMGIASATAHEMGHLAVSGETGSLAWLSRLNVPRRIYVHINNTNPMLNDHLPERRMVNECGVEVGMDGDIVDI